MHRVRIRVPKEALVVAALVLAVVIPFSRPAYTWLRRISAKKQLNISDGLDHAESSSDPQVLLAEANRLYWLNNGPKAAPLYAKAEKFFADRGDSRNQLYAQIGRLRSEAETMSFVDLSRFLNDRLQNPIMRNDPRLRLWCLAAKGYSLTRKRRERGYRREELTRFGHIPSRKSTLLWLAARYAFVDKSILVVTEGLGPRRFHGRVVLMVNEHTASAGEMVAAFAEENNLATIVGTKTPGRLLSGGAFKVGHGYILGLPVAGYLTWQGRTLENNGITPAFSVDLSRDALREGRDTQLEQAVEVVKTL